MSLQENCWPPATRTAPDLARLLNVVRGDDDTGFRALRREVCQVVPEAGAEKWVDLEGKKREGEVGGGG